MGSKAAVIAFFDEKSRKSRRDYRSFDGVRATKLAEAVLRTNAEESGTGTLFDALWPDRGVLHVGAFAGLDLVCSREFAQSRPSRLTEQVLALAGGRDACAVFMHGGDDWAAFATWSANALTRSLSLRPDSGVIEDVGSRLEFEQPFWNGERRVHHAPAYPFPFHPVDLGNEALRAHLGFILEGRPDDTCFDPEEITLPGFRPRPDQRE